MKTQRKQLTRKQMRDICKQRKSVNKSCIGCPLLKDLRIGASVMSFCYPKDIFKLEKFINEFDNEEIDIEDTKVEEPWVSEQDKNEAMASSLGRMLDGLAMDMSCE